MATDTISPSTNGTPRRPPTDEVRFDANGTPRRGGKFARDPEVSGKPVKVEVAESVVAEIDALRNALPALATKRSDLVDAIIRTGLSAWQQGAARAFGELIVESGRQPSLAEVEAKIAQAAK